MATWGLDSQTGEKFNNKKVREVIQTEGGRDYLMSLHNGNYNITLTHEVLEKIISLKETQIGLQDQIETHY